MFGSFNDLKVRGICFMSLTAAQAAAKRERHSRRENNPQRRRFVKANQRGEGQEEGSCVKGGRKGG